MKKFFALIFFLSFSIFVAQKPSNENGIIDTNKVLVPDQHHSKINQVVTNILTRHHFKKTDVTDSLSSIVFDNIIKSLDFNRVYFLKDDIQEFEKNRYNVDDFLLKGSQNFAFDVFNRYKIRLNERINFIKKTLKHEFDYSIDESYVPDRKDEPFANTLDELNNIWRKRLKNDALNKKLNGDDWEKISTDLFKRYKNYHKMILQYKSEDVFQLYMNAFATAIDPHSSYFSPITSENFNISMARSLEGIGAQLTSRDDYTTIVRIVPGGPADRSENLFENDRIVAVGQDDEGEMVDVVGWRTDDVVQLIRGKKGTKVRLEILRADDTPDMPTELLSLIRDKVTLEEQSAQSEIIYLNENGTPFKLGVVKIPAFYIDFKARARGEKNYKSTTRDVKRLIAELTQEKVDGIIVDLRNNGGGSLQEAIELTGLFIESGPVVQVKDARGAININSDPDPAIFYDGPMAVLLNRRSASASEIFSAAIQDYGRGLVIGEQTFGKGTVQNLFDLNRVIRFGDNKLGNVKLTIAKYYRINGSSTQKRGVIPDITYPSPVEPAEYGESSYPTSLKWDQIETSYYEAYDNLADYLPALLKNHKQRIAGDIEFQFLMEDIEEMKSKKEKKSFSLNKDVRKAERDEAERKKKLREEERQKKANLKMVKKSEVNKDETTLDDPQLEESGRILADLIILKYG